MTASTSCSAATAARSARPPRWPPPPGTCSSGRPARSAPCRWAPTPARLTFRVPPTGGTLGRNAIAFTAERLARGLGRDPASFRYAVSFVDDVYGRVGGRRRAGRARRARAWTWWAASGTTSRPSTPARWRTGSQRLRPDVLFVSAYLDDAVGDAAGARAPARAAPREHRHVLELLHARLRRHARRPTPWGCSPPTSRARTRSTPPGLARRGRGAARTRRRRRTASAYDEEHEPRRAGRLLRVVGPVPPRPAGVGGRSRPTAIADAALAQDLPRGSLPNGSGLRFGAPGEPGAGDNLQAASVVWEWVHPGPRRGGVAARVRHPPGRPPWTSPDAAGTRRGAGRSRRASPSPWSTSGSPRSPGSLSPLARRPLLDGNGAGGALPVGLAAARARRDERAADGRRLHPPPDRPTARAPDVLTTDDAQVTLILQAGDVRAPRPGSATCTSR